MTDSILWDRLNSLNTEDLVKRAGIRVVGEDLYELDILNEVVQIDLTNRSIKSQDFGYTGETEEYLYVAVLMYLLEAKEIEPAGEWVNPRELPGGRQFFSGVHEVPTARIQARFGGSKERFEKTCIALGGKTMDFADIAYSFQVFNRLPVAVLLWLEDDEFPARVSTLVDKTARFHFPLDALLGALSILEIHLLIKDIGQS